MNVSGLYVLPRFSLCAWHVIVLSVALPVSASSHGSVCRIHCLYLSVALPV